MRNTAGGLVLVLWALGIPAPAQDIDFRVDQRHDWPEELESYHSIQSLAPLVQEFTPTLGAMNVVEVWTQDIAFPRHNGLGATLEVWIRQGSTNGAVIGVSRPLSLPDGWDGPSRFVFPEWVSLVPEQLHALEIRAIEGDNWGANSHGQLFPPAYPRGRYIIQGHPVDHSDLWFRTGITFPDLPVHFHPDTGLRWLGVPPLTYRIWGSVNLREWGELGSLTATGTNCIFTNLALGEPKLFFRVSHP